VPSVFGLSYAPCIGNPDTAIGNDRGRCQVIVRPLVARPSFERALDERVSWTSAAANETASWNTGAPTARPFRARSAREPDCPARSLGAVWRGCARAARALRAQVTAGTTRR